MAKKLFSPQKKGHQGAIRLFWWLLACVIRRRACVFLRRCGRWPQPAAVASSLGSQWAAGGWIPPHPQRSAGPGRCSSLHTAAQLSSQLFAPGSSSRTCSVGMAATMSAMALCQALYRNGAREACRSPRDDPVIVRWVRLCVSLGSVCENGVMVYVDYIFDYSGSVVRIDKPILHLDTCGRRDL